MSLKPEIAIKRLMACVAASIFCACSPTKSGDSQVAQDTPMTSVASTNSESNVTDDSNPKSSRLSTLATATTFEAIGVTPEFYCERRDPSSCYVQLFPPTNDIVDLKVTDPTNPHRLVRHDSAFEDAFGYTGNIPFPADLDPQFIAYYVPSFTLSDDLDEADLPADVWWETALLPVIWSQTECSGVMRVNQRVGVPDHPLINLYFVNENGGADVQTLLSMHNTSIELTVSGYKLIFDDGETASLILTPDDEGRCVAVVQTNE